MLLANAEQASLVQDPDIIPVASLKDIFLHLKKEVVLEPYRRTKQIDRPNLLPQPPLIDNVHGQKQAKQALIIAAAGHHNILFTGSPGAGKTMLAKTLVNLLPQP